MGWSGSSYFVAHKHLERRATRPYTCFSGRGSPLYSTSYRFCCSPFMGCVLLLVLYSAFESNPGICKTSICPLQFVCGQRKLDIIGMSVCLSVSNSYTFGTCLKSTGPYHPQNVLRTHFTRMLTLSNLYSQIILMPSSIW